MPIALRIKIIPKKSPKGIHTIFVRRNRIFSDLKGLMEFLFLNLKVIPIILESNLTAGFFEVIKIS